jgi:hypothetical protein
MVVADPDEALIEAIAEAIHVAQDGWPIAWADLHEDMQAGYLDEARAEAAEAKLARVEKLRDEWEHGRHLLLEWNVPIAETAATALRAALADAPAEQRAEVEWCSTHRANFPLGAMHCEGEQDVRPCSSPFPTAGDGRG